MAHELNIEEGQASMMFVGEVPWHGLGTRLQKAPKTAEEAIKAARLEWEVGQKRVYGCEGQIFHEIEDRKAVVRLDHYRDPWRRLDSLWFGEGERIKHRAFDEAATLVTTA